MKYLVFLVVLFMLSSCVEIIDDLTFKSDGSGTFKYTLNLSASKVKVNSVLALDSLDLKIQCDFTSIVALQKAIKEIVIDESKSKKEIESYWLTWEGNKLTRSVPSITGDLTSRLKKEDIEGLKKGNYMSITRFDRPIEKCENSTSLISANKMAVMLKITPYALIQNVSLLENSIMLSDKK